MLYAIAKKLSGIITAVFVKRVTGVKNIPKDPFILIVNHSSYLDPMIISSVFLKQKHELYFVAARHLYRNILERFIFGNVLKCIKVNGSIEIILDALNKNQSVCIFPEGGRSPDGRLQKVKNTGAAVLATLAGVPVVPMALKGTFGLWPRYKTFPRIKKNVEVRIGKPIRVKKKKKITKAEAKKLMNKFIKELARLM